MNGRLKNLEPQLAWLFLLVTFVLVITLAGTAQTKDADTEGSGEQVQNPVAAEVQTPGAAETENAEVHRTSGRHFRLAWDNTLKYSNAFRVEDRNPRLIDASFNSFNVNQDDGDRNFHRGLISNRVDLLTEMDLTYGTWGVRASGAAWNDQSYNQRNANNSPYTINNLTADYNHFTQSTRDIHFRNADLLDAFAFGTFHFANGEISLRGGQFAQIWGETLFFGNNGIAGGMAPIDIVKAVSVPFTQFKELVRPVPQVSLGYGRRRMSIEAYYQLDWVADRFPTCGSYFASVDLMGQVILAAPLPVINPVTDLPIWGVFTQVHSPGVKNWGQGGLQFRLRPGNGWEVALYAIQYHEKAPQTSYVTLGTGAPIPVGLPTDPMLQIGTFYLVYPENVKSFGFGATKTRGVVNYAIELSGRTHVDLVSNGQTITPGHGMVGSVITADTNNNPLYATGSSIHGNLSALASLMPNFVAKESSLIAEIGWNRLVSISKNPGALDPGATRDAVGWQVTYSPTYRQVRHGLDLSPNVGWSFFPMGKSSVVGGFGVDKGGTVSVGLSATYRETWRSGLNYNHFYGPVGSTLNPNGTFTYKQSSADRDFIAFSIYRSFGLRAATGRSK